MNHSLIGKLSVLFYRKIKENCKEVLTCVEGSVELWSTNKKYILDRKSSCFLRPHSYRSPRWAYK